MLPYQNYVLVDKDLDKLDEIILGGDEFANLIGDQSKKEFLSAIGNDVLKFNSCEVLDILNCIDYINAERRKKQNERKIL